MYPSLGPRDLESRDIIYLVQCLKSHHQNLQRLSSHYCILVKTRSLNQSVVASAGRCIVLFSIQRLTQGLIRVSFHAGSLPIRSTSQQDQSICSTLWTLWITYIPAFPTIPTFGIRDSVVQKQPGKKDRICIVPDTPVADNVHRLCK